MKEHHPVNNLTTTTEAAGGAGNQKLETSAVMASSMLRSTLVTDGKFESSVTATNASASTKGKAA